MKPFFFLMLALQVFSVGGQTLTSNPLYFDFQRYTVLQEKGEECIAINDSMETCYTVSLSGYQEHTTIKNSHYNENRTFYLSNKRLRHEGKCFQRFPVGVHHEYDEAGNLVSSIDHDSLFGFSLQEVAKKITELCGKNIYDLHSGISVSRTYREDAVFYQVFDLGMANWHGPYRAIHIDGMTGEVLLDTIVYNNK